MNLYGGNIMLTRPSAVFEPAGRDDEFACQYMEAIRANASDAEQAIARQLILMTVLGALFLLLTKNLISSVEFLSIKLSNYSYLQASIPPAIAAVYLSFLNTMQTEYQLLKSHSLLIEHLRPRLYENHYERLLWPPAGPFSGEAALAPALSSSWYGKITRYVGKIRLSLYFLAPTAIVIYGIYHLFTFKPGWFQYLTAAASIALITISLPQTIWVGRRVL